MAPTPGAFPWEAYTVPTTGVTFSEDSFADWWVGLLHLNKGIELIKTKNRTDLRMFLVIVILV
jgi:hypothetical protein